MLYAGLDIHKAVFQAAVLDPDSGELSESRFEPSRERLTDWAMQWQGKLAAVARCCRPVRAVALAVAAATLLFAAPAGGAVPLAGRAPPSPPIVVSALSIRSISARSSTSFASARAICVSTSSR